MLRLGLGHQEFELAGLVAAGREAGAVVALDPEVDPQFLAQARQLLERSYAATPSVDVADALVQAEVTAGAPLHDARAGYVRHMVQEPSLIAAARWTIAGRRRWSRLIAGSGMVAGCCCSPIRACAGPPVCR